MRAVHLTHPRLGDLLREEPGWTGGFTRANAPGALRAGTRIVKVNSEPNDSNADGAQGTVLGSISHPEVMLGAPFYFVEWQDKPKFAMGILGHKVKRAGGWHPPA